MNISAYSAVEIGHRVKFTIRAMDGLGGTSDSYRATLSGKRGTVTDLPERHMALVLWDGHEKPERVVRHYLEPEFTTTPAPDVQAQIDALRAEVDRWRNLLRARSAKGV